MRFGTNSGAGFVSFWRSARIPGMCVFVCFGVGRSEAGFGKEEPLPPNRRPM